MSLLDRICYHIHGINSLFKRGEKNVLNTFSGKTIEYNIDSNIHISNSLILINSKYKVDENIVDLNDFCDIGNNRTINKNAYENLKKIFCDCEKETGGKLIVTSGSRSAKEQEEIYNRFPKSAVPSGESEHQSGLAVDLKSDGYAKYRFSNSKQGKWVEKNAHRYGFIIRYPYYKRNKTKVSYEPWHIRYVSYPHSEIVFKSKMILEEYILGLEVDKIYMYKDMYISRQKVGNSFMMPTNISEIKLSMDNTGYMIISARNGDV